MPKSREKILAKGGGTLYVRPLTSGGTWIDLGYLSEVTINSDLELAKVTAGDGSVLDEHVVSETVTLSATLLQTSFDEINTIINARDTYFDVFYSVEVKPGLYQELYIPLARIRPKLTLGYKAELRNLPIEIIALLGKHTTSQTVSGTGGNFTIEVGRYFGFRESATSIAPITETVDSVKNKFL